MSYGLAVLLGRIAVTGIESIGVDDRSILELGLILDQIFNPGSGNDVGTILFAGVKLDRDLSSDVAVNFAVDLLKAFRGKVSGEIHDRLIALSLLKRNVLISVCSGNCIGNHFYICHFYSS